MMIAERRFRVAVRVTIADTRVLWATVGEFTQPEGGAWVTLMSWGIHRLLKGTEASTGPGSGWHVPWAAHTGLCVASCDSLCQGSARSSLRDISTQDVGKALYPGTLLSGFCSKFSLISPPQVLGVAVTPC